MGDRYRIALIWDVDGTLMDSYEVIVTGLVDTFATIGIKCDPKEVHDFVIKTSVTEFINTTLEGTGYEYKDIKEYYSKRTQELTSLYKPMKGAREIIEKTNAMGVENFIYTHRGKSTADALKQIGLDGLFCDVVNSENGFARKPDPAGIEHLIEKYTLDPNLTFYVGDRHLDMECAANAGVYGIFFLEEGSVLEPDGTEDYVIHDLAEIESIVTQAMRLSR